MRCYARITDTALRAREILRHGSAGLDEPAVALRPGGHKGRNREASSIARLKSEGSLIIQLAIIRLSPKPVISDTQYGDDKLISRSQDHYQVPGSASVRLVSAIIEPRAPQEWR